MGFPGGSGVKNLPANAGGRVLISKLGRSPGEGNSNPLQYSGWGIPWTEEHGGVVHGVTKRVGHDLATKHVTESFPCQ